MDEVKQSVDEKAIPKEKEVSKDSIKHRIKKATESFPKIAKLAKPLNMVEKRALVDAQLSDTGNAERLRLLFGDSIMYVPEKPKGSRWHVWTGKVWKSVFDEQMCDFISFTMRCTAEIGADIIKSSSDKKKKAIKAFLAYCARSEDVSKINAALQRASSMLVKHIIELDTNQLLLNVRNGIVDLQTGQLLQHDRQYYCTRICNACYIKGASHGSLWEQTMQQIIPDSNVLEYLHVYTGYMATGKASEESILFLYGEGGAGKGTFANTIDYVLGDYSDTFDPEILLSSRFDSDGGRSASPGRAKLAGLRAAWASETGLGRKLNDAAIKNLTGRDDITARFLYGQPFTFTQNAKMVISSNYLPNLKDVNDGGIRRRLKIVGFHEVFADHADKNLKEKLREPQEMAAVLDWLVQGAVDWCRNGLPELPNSVKVEMNKYYEDNDWLADALGELTVPDSSGRIKAIVLLEAIYDWLGHFGRNSDYTRSSLVELISKHGYSYKRIHGTRYFCGLSIKPGTNSEAANDESQETTSMQWDDPVPPPPEHPGTEELAVESWEVPF